MDVYPQVIRDIIYGYVSHSERFYLTTRNLGWVLHSPYVFDIDFVMGLKQHFRYEPLLNIAAAQNRLDIVKKMVKRCDMYFDATNLACANGHLQMVEFLYEVQRVHMQLKSWNGLERCPPGIHDAVQNNQWHILEFICKIIGGIDQAVNVCCQETNPQYLSRLSSIIPMTREKVFQKVLDSKHAWNVYRWIIDEYMEMKDSEYKRIVFLYVFTFVPHFDTRMLDVSKEWYSIPVAGNVQMLDWLLARSTFDKERWRKQAETAVVVNDVELLKRCPCMPVQFDIIEMAIKHGNVEMIKLLRMHDQTRDIAVKYQQYHLIPYTNSALSFDIPSKEFDLNVCMELCKWHPYSKYSRNADVFFVQLQFQLHLPGKKIFPYHQRKWLDHVPETDVELIAFLRECFAYALSDNVYWFATCVTHFKRSYENRSWLLVLVLDRKAYHCLEWMCKEKFIHNLPTVAVGFTSERACWDHKKLMKEVHAMMLENPHLNRSCCVLI